MTARRGNVIRKHFDLRNFLLATFSHVQRKIPEHETVKQLIFAWRLSHALEVLSEKKTGCNLRKKTIFYNMHLFQNDKVLLTKSWLFFQKNFRVILDLQKKLHNNLRPSKQTRASSSSLCSWKFALVFGLSGIDPGRWFKTLGTLCFEIMQAQGNEEMSWISWLQGIAQLNNDLCFKSR